MPPADPNSSRPPATYEEITAAFGDYGEVCSDHAYGDLLTTDATTKPPSEEN